MDAFLGEIRLFPWGFTPKNWLPCNGALLSVQQNQALFSLLGTAYGGNGVTNFGLPDLRGRVIVGNGTNASGTAYPSGLVGGVENVTLNLAQIPNHTHALNAVNAVSTSGAVVNNVFANTPGASTYGTQAPVLGEGASSVGSVGGNQPHANMQPSLVMNYCIASTGVYPSRN